MRSTDGEPPQPIVTLLQRVVDLLVQLIGGKIELTTRQLTASANEASRRAGLAFAGGLTLLLGVALLADAAVVALAPLVSSLALRLLLVAAPVCLVGARLLVRALAPSARGGSHPAMDERDGYRGHAQDHQHVARGADRIPAEHTD